MFGKTLLRVCIMKGPHPLGTPVCAPSGPLDAVDSFVSYIGVSHELSADGLHASMARWEVHSKGVSHFCADDSGPLVQH